jgi:hypothetical protein
MVSDITYLRTSGTRVYPMMVLDLYDRNVIGRDLSADMETAHTTILAVEMAFTNRRVWETPIFRSSRGYRIIQKPFVSGLRNRASDTPKRELEGELSGQHRCRNIF